jgi:cytochrome c-type biogenesis protein CcmI
MIWFIVFLFSLIVFAYVSVPLWSKTPLAENGLPMTGHEVSDYRDELLKIEADISSGDGDITTLTSQKRHLEKRLLASATQPSPALSESKNSWLVGIFVALIVSTFGLYLLLGSPALTHSTDTTPSSLSVPQALSQSSAESVPHENNASMDDLIAGLEKKLSDNNENPQQWGLYARSLMTVNRFEEAFLAYERTLELTDNNPNIAAELESARAFAAQQRGMQPPAQQAKIPPLTQPGPSAEDIEAAKEMTDADRAAMIQGMVDGLSERLSDKPDDPNGWVRLLRARQVLGQTEIAAKEITDMKKHYAADPDLAALILQRSGYPVQ